MLGELVGDPQEQARQAGLIVGALLARATAEASEDGSELILSVRTAGGTRMTETLPLTPNLSAELVRHAAMRLVRRNEQAGRAAEPTPAADPTVRGADLARSLVPEGSGAGFRATKEGGFALLEPLTTNAEEWLSQHVGEEATWYDDQLVVELRYWPDLVDAIVDAGFLFERESLPN